MHERWPTNDRTCRILLRTGPIKNGSKESDLACSPTLSAMATVYANETAGVGVKRMSRIEPWMPQLARVRSRLGMTGQRDGSHSIASTN
jgi:hypothetical protein